MSQKKGVTAEELAARFGGGLGQRESGPPAPSAAPRPGPLVLRDHLELDPDDVKIEGAYVRSAPSEEAVEELARSFAEQGQLQAIGVRQVGTALAPRYVLVWGRTRLEAARRAGRRVIARNLGAITEEDAYLHQALENIARHDMHPAEQAAAIAKILQARKVRQKEVGLQIGRPESWVSYMRASGEAILALDPAERGRLTALEEVSVRYLQALATEPLEVRVERLRELLAGQGSRQPGSRAQRPGVGRTTQLKLEGGIPRSGALYRLRVDCPDEDLRSDPEGVLARLQAFFDEQLGAIRQRANELAEEPPAKDGAS